MSSFSWVSAAPMPIVTWTYLLMRPSLLVVPSTLHGVMSYPKGRVQIQFSFANCRSINVPSAPKSKSACVSTIQFQTFSRIGSCNESLLSFEHVTTCETSILGGRDVVHSHLRQNPLLLVPRSLPPCLPLAVPEPSP